MDMESTAAPATKSKGRAQAKDDERLYIASQWTLMWLHFKRHRLALLGGVVICVLYFVAVFHGFLAPYHKLDRTDFIYMSPQKVIFSDGDGFSLRPHVYGITTELDKENFERNFITDKDTLYPVKLFVRGAEYDILGLIKSDLHLFGVPEGGHIFLLGTDKLGRDVFSRMLYGSAISLSIGLVGVLASFILGAILGGVSGYYGGAIDNVMQRIIEFLISLPTIPLWIALSAAVPTSWTAVQVYFAITLILSLRGWCGLARVVRSKLLETREEDFVMAAQLAGSSDWRIITRHLLPSFMSYLIVNMTLAIPNMILGETALSFLGLGLRPPVVSWGVLLQQAQNIRAVASYPWLMYPGALVIITVLSFNFMGDGLRDAADPYKI